MIGSNQCVIRTQMCPGKTLLHYAITRALIFLPSLGEYVDVMHVYMYNSMATH